MLTYTQCATLFDSARNPEAGKPLANNTRLLRRGDAYAVRLHETDILTFLPSGAVRYNSGGWHTMTTKERMNEYGPATVYSDAGVWFIGGRPFADAGGVPFKDGCRVERGRVIGAASPAHAAAERKLRRAIGAFAKTYIEKLYAGEIEAPSAGDCWGCVMQAADGTRPMAGKGLASCIRQHVKDSYYVPSLIWRALDARQMGSAFRGAVGYLQKIPGAENCGGWARGGHMPQDLRGMLRRFCMVECGLAP